jgi:hypothetical protein
MVVLNFMSFIISIYCVYFGISIIKEMLKMKNSGFVKKLRYFIIYSIIIISILFLFNHFGSLLNRPQNILYSLYEIYEHLTFFLVLFLVRLRIKKEEI